MPNTTSPPGGVAPFFPQALSFKATNAIVLAALAKAAYADSAVAQATAASFGLTDFQWIDLSEQFRDVYGFAAGCKDYAVLAFRGTADLRDWMTNLNAAPARFSWFWEGAREAGEVHSGFALAVRHSWDQIIAAVDRVLPRPPSPPDLRGLSTTPQSTLWLTGHSLGGALAVLAAAAFSMTNTLRPVRGIYTFGQPRVGLFNFCDQYNQLLRVSTFRFVNKEDLVPRVPFRGWDYADVGAMIHFDSTGKPVLNSSQWKNFLSRNIESFKDFFGIATHIEVDVGDHSMAGYETLVQSNAAKLDQLFS